MQETTGNDVTRLCRNDKIMYAIFVLNIAIVVIWSITLNLGAPAKNTERKKTDTIFVQTEKLQNRVDTEGYSIVPLMNMVHEEVEQVTMSLMAYETMENVTMNKQLNLEEFGKSVLNTESLLSGIVTDALKKCTTEIKKLEEKKPKATEPSTEETATTKKAEQDTTNEAKVETDGIVEEIPVVEHPVYLEEYVEPETEAPVTYSYNGPVLSAWNGTVQGPSGKETYYNLNMSGVISIMNANGYNYTYWVRSDGCKMFGDYIMCAANLNIHPRGSLVETSLGTAIVCDTGGFAYNNAYQIDIATTW